jgi:hypothetical protein
MIRRVRLAIALAALTLAGCIPPGEVLPESGYPRPEEIPVEAWRFATAAYDRAMLRGQVSRPRLTVIDYTRPATVPRLGVVDLSPGQLLTREFVAHGRESGGLWARAFSNVDGSRRSSLGTFVTAGTFRGVRGLSLRLRGLEPGINDHAWQRGIVVHGTPNVSAARARAGTMGRTEGCPAVPTGSVRKLIRMIEGGSVVFVWYPDPGLLEKSEYVVAGRTEE